jgi:hypothetical protein
MEATMQPDAIRLLERSRITTPFIGFYDAPDSKPFEPLTVPKPDTQTCTFTFYKQWLKGKTLHLTKDNFGCGGAGRCIFGFETRSRKDFIKFLADDEGLKASHDLMNQWIEFNKPYQPKYPNILIGPLKANQYQYLKSVTFYVNPDQLSLLMIGAQYHSAPGDPIPVLASFGSGCMQLMPVFNDLTIPQAMVGATDIAMRQYLPPDILAFSVTKPMFEQLCSLNERSFLYKPFWQRLMKARGVDL